LRLCLAAVVAVLGSAGAEARSRRPQLVPATYSQKVDSLGFNWDININTGQVNRGTNYCFSSAQVLTVNGSGVHCPQPMMTPDGSEYVLRCPNVAGMEVTRRIKVDLKSGTVRYVDTFKNTGRSSLSVTAMVRTQTNTHCQTVVTDTGGQVPAGLGKKDCGLFAVQPRQYNRPSVAFYLCSPGAKQKPTVSVKNNNYTYLFTYAISVAPGKETSILHGIGQRAATTALDSKTLAGVFRPFKSRSWMRDLPAGVRRTIVNLRGGGFGGPARMLEALEALDVCRGSQDILAVGEETRLTGTVMCASLTVTTPHGKISVPFENVAALTGRSCGTLGQRVFLRDGQILVGSVEADGLSFTTGSGVTMKLPLESLDRVVTHESPDGDRPGDGVTAWLEVASGARLALVMGADDARAPVAMVTPWGGIEVPVDDIFFIRMAPEGAFGHHIALKDGSRFSAFLEGGALELHTLLFGRLSFDLVELRSLDSRTNGEEDKVTDELERPHVVLAGENVFAGRIDLAEVVFVASGQNVPVPPEQIRTMEIAADEGDDAGGTEPVFTAELWSGGTVSGKLDRPVVPVRVGEAVLQCPARDIVRVAVPSPTVPARLRDRIAALLRDLGHPDWETRETATRELGGLGYITRQQLLDALKVTTDPEVRKRVQGLLDGMD